MPVVLTSLNRLYKSLWPCLAFFLATFASQYLSVIDRQWHSTLLYILPVGLCALTLGFSLKFNQSRISQAIIILALVLIYKHNNSLQNLFHQDTAIILLSFCLLILSFSKDRQLLSTHGFLRCIVLSIALALAHVMQDPAWHNQSWLISFQTHIKAFLAPGLTQLTLNLEVLPLASFSALTLVFCFAFMQAITALISNTALYACLAIAQGLLIAISFTQLNDLQLAMLYCSILLIFLIQVLNTSYNMAYRDELTGIPSRRALNHLLLSLGRKYTIAMLDIDHFKKFNDTHGHDIGDEVLRMVAFKIAKVTGSGKPFRYGGEEFTIVFPNKSPEQAVIHLEQLRETIAQYEMTVRKSKRPKDNTEDKQARAKRGRGKSKGTASQKHDTLSVTISIGVANRQGDVKTPEQVIKAADKALYRAKKNGRNCVSS